MNLPDSPIHPQERPAAPLNPSSINVLAPDAVEGGSSAERPGFPGRHTALTGAQTVGTALLGIIATFYGGCALALGMYAFAEP